MRPERTFIAHQTMWRTINNKIIIPNELPHKIPPLDRTIAQEILKENRCWAIRWESDFDTNYATDWWHIIKREHWEISDYSSKTRNQIRRGLRDYDISPSTKDLILKNCEEAFLEANVRHGISAHTASRDHFIRYIESLTPSRKFWLITKKSDGSSVGFCENLEATDACFYSSIWINNEALRGYASYALIHQMNSYYLNTLKLSYVNDGARSISHQTNIQNFLKEKMGFREAFCILHVEYSPLFAQLIKLAYPLKKTIDKLNLRATRPISALLTQEAIRQSMR